VPATVPDYLPARMLNEFVYCPRLFYYEWVEGVFVDNRETVEGSLRHAKMDQKSDALPTAEEAVAAGETIHSRSVTLSSETHRLIAKMDLIESSGKGDGNPVPFSGPVVSPVDYKRGSPREGRDGELGAWDTDRVQLAVQALVLRENGYPCHEGVIYYVSTKQRVRVPIDEALVSDTLDALRRARETADSQQMPPPLVDSPKCPRCSLVTVCLPDETRALSPETGTETFCRKGPEGASQKTFPSPFPAAGGGTRQATLFDVEPTVRAVVGMSEVEEDVRRLVPARDDLRPLYLNTQGLRVGKTGNVLKVQEKDKVVQEVRVGEICQLNLLGNIQLSTQAVQALCEAEVPIAYFSMGGWFYGVTHGLGVKNIYLRREQFRLADVPAFCLRLARALVAGKIRNQRTMLQRNHVEPPPSALVQMKCMLDDAERADSMEELLGIEGNAARVYFENFSGMVKLDEVSIGNGMPPESRGVPERAEPATGENEPEGDVAARRIALAPREESHPQGVGDGARRTNGRSAEPFSFDFVHRNRRPPRDAVNALLSLAYSVLAKDLTIVCHTVGFDPYLGFYHQPRFGRAALALDLMEPFRPLIADSAVLSAINTRMIGPRDFIRTGDAVALKRDGRKAFFRAYEQRMDTLVTHPLFGYRVNYRRILEIQARLLERVLRGEASTYPVFTTR
jgi:CRISPR-associated protein Cas1